MQQQSATTYYAAPPTYYLVQGSYQGFQAPTHTFPERPPGMNPHSVKKLMECFSAQNVYVYDMPPPYPGIGQTNPYPAGQFQPAGTVQYQNIGAYPGMPGQPGQPQPPQQPGQYNPYPTNQPPQPGFNVGQGAAPSASGLPQYQQLQQQSSAQPPAYNAYQEAPPLPSKNGPL